MKHKNEILPFSKGAISLGLGLVLSGSLLLPGNASADTLVSLSDGGSTAAVDLTSSTGMYNWSVGGQNELNQQWFWYAIGNTAPQPINNIGLSSYYLTGLNEVTATYSNPQVTLSIDYLLSGGGVGSGSADITESISAVNTSGGSIDFHFYQYSDFDLLGDGNNNVQIFGTPGSWNFVEQTAGSSGIGEAIVAPNANHAEAAILGQTLGELTNGVSPVTLNDNPTAAGYVTWALEWDTTLANGDVFDLTKDKSLYIQVVPEPSTMALIAIGLGVLGMAQRRRAS